MIEKRAVIVDRVHTTYRNGWKSPLGWIVAAYVLVCTVALPWHFHRVAPDASAYLTIARKYHAWNFYEAVNGYWSPLLCWLIAPFLGFGWETDVTARFVDVAIGAGAIVGTWWLAKRLQLPASACTLTALSVVAPVTMYVLRETSPDVLVAGLLVGYLGVVVGDDYPRSLGQGAACGLLGALAYLAKAYALPFFLTHFVAVSVYLLVRRCSTPAERRRLVAVTATALLVFGVLAGAWIGVISYKYSRFTFGTTGAYQFRVIAPGSRGNPLDRGGLYPPATDTAVSAWEDPSDLAFPANVKPVRPAAKVTPATHERSAKDASLSRSTIVWQTIFRYLNNVVALCGVLVRLTPAWPLIGLGLLLACIRKPRGAIHERCMILLGTLVLYPAGYVLIFIVARYFWFMTFVLAATAFMLPAALPLLREKRWRNVWSVAVVISFAVWPVYVMVRTWDHVLERTYTLAGKLHSELPPGTRIASDDEFGITNCIAYQLGARYHGILRPDGSTEEHERQLREQGIQCLMIWGDPAGHPFLKSARELPDEPFKAARFHRVPRVFALPPAAP